MTAVYLHIGEPKTGTTFLQQVLQGNRAALGEHGVTLPGRNQYAVFRATQDLRGMPRRADDPAPPWDGEWDELAAEACAAGAAGGADGVSVISHELFCAATAEQADRAVASFAGAELHVVLSVRDMASLLPAEWQESVKHRSTRAWDDWVADVVDVESLDPDRSRFWFWRVHDTAAILRLWEAAGVPRERLHVVTMPRSGAEPGLLWHRFAEVIGVSPDAADIARARRNASLGVPEMELLRRFNASLSNVVPNWYYTRHVKDGLAHGPLAQRSGGARLSLPPSRLSWAADYGNTLAAALTASGYPVTGDLAELVPSVPTAVDGPAGPRPEEASDEEMTAAALDATAALLRQRHREITEHATEPLTRRRAAQLVARTAARSATRSVPVLGSGLSRAETAARRVRGSVRRRVEGARPGR